MDSNQDLELIDARVLEDDIKEEIEALDDFDGAVDKLVSRGLKIALKIVQKQPRVRVDREDTDEGH